MKNTLHTSSSTCCNFCCCNTYCCCIPNERWIIL